MIDIHSHVLPFVDDGSTTLKASLEMIKTEVEYGVTDLFLTPHFMKTRNYLSTYENNLKVFEDFKKEVQRAGYKINLHLGNEIYYTIDSMRFLKNKMIKSMGDSKFVLVEFSMSEAEEDIADAIHNLKAAGYIPIVAHPERYSYLTNIDDYELIKKMGAYIQLNAHSIVGKYGPSIQKLCMKLIRIGLVDFIASDVHEFRSNYLKEAFNIINKKFGETIANKLFNNTIILN